MARRYTVTFPDDLYAVIERRAQREDRSIANLIVVTMRKVLMESCGEQQRPQSSSKRPPQHC